MLDQIITIAKSAGAEVLKFYGSNEGVEMKANNSPLTLADQASHVHICQALRALDPDIAIVSEEATEEENLRSQQASRYWLVDPLDGTKEFIKQTGQFTVNIALIQDDAPVLGVIFTPVLDLLYYAEKGKGAWRQEKGGAASPIQVKTAKPPQLKVVASRDHAGPRVAEMLKRLPEAELTSMGSSLKFCLVAEGKADLYPRFVPTMEWDTAAAQCIVETAGGELLELNGAPLKYGKSTLKNPSIITVGDKALRWQSYLS